MRRCCRGLSTVSVVIAASAAGACRKTLSVGREESIVADEHETAIPDLDILHRRTKFGQPLDDFVRVPDPAVPVLDATMLR